MSQLSTPIAGWRGRPRSVRSGPENQGLLLAGLTFAGAKETIVEVESFTETEAIYRVSWK